MEQRNSREGTGDLNAQMAKRRHFLNTVVRFQVRYQVEDRVLDLSAQIIQRKVKLLTLG